MSSKLFLGQCLPPPLRGSSALSSKMCDLGLGMSSVVDGLPTMHEVLFYP